MRTAPFSGPVHGGLRSREIPTMSQGSTMTKHQRGISQARFFGNPAGYSLQLRHSRRTPSAVAERLKAAAAEQGTFLELDRSHRRRIVHGAGRRDRQGRQHGRSAGDRKCHAVRHHRGEWRLQGRNDDHIADFDDVGRRHVRLERNRHKGMDDPGRKFDRSAGRDIALRERRNGQRLRSRWPTRRCSRLQASPPR